MVVILDVERIHGAVSLYELILQQSGYIVFTNRSVNDIMRLLGLNLYFETAPTG